MGEGADPLFIRTIKLNFGTKANGGIEMMGESIGNFDTYIRKGVNVTYMVVDDLMATMSVAHTAASANGASLLEYIHSFFQMGHNEIAHIYKSNSTDSKVFKLIVVYDTIRINKNATYNLNSRIVTKIDSHYIYER